MMKKITATTFLCFLFTCTTALMAQNPTYNGIVYVTPTGAGTHSGDSWANATSSIATAQSLAQIHNCVVWVAAGIYYGDTSSTAENAFIMVDGVNVYGGFAGTEPANYDLTLRDFETNASVLDGDSARRVLNSYHDFIINEITWDGFTIRNGNTSEGGGGVYLWSKCKLNHCKIQNNMAEYGGGVLAGHFAVVSNCQIFENSSLGSNGWWGYGGGGVYLTSSAEIYNCLIYDNISNNSGGGVYAHYSSTLNNCSIFGNMAEYGGGVYASHFANVSYCQIFENSSFGSIDMDGGGGVFFSDSAKVHDCLIYNNISNFRGGGIYAYSSTLDNCKIFGNMSVSSGGGIDVAHMTVTSCEIYNNTSSNDGGGVNASVNVKISNCMIYNNTTNNNGGGVKVFDFSNNIHSAIVSNCLISNNMSNCGGGIYMENATITNSTIVRNYANYGAGAYGNMGVLTNNIVWGNGEDVSNNIYGNIICSYSAVEGGFLGDHNLPLGELFNQQPLFVNPSLTAGASDTTANVDWHFLPGSPCINRGNNDVVTDNLDLDGTARIKRDTVDMGCYETDFYSSPIVNPNYSNVIYVTQNGSGSQTGDSWANAISSIEDAQMLAKTYNAIVWVAAGTYYGDTSAASENAFTMHDGVNVYGGFSGNEPADYDLSLRDFEANSTILDGQNARRVLYQPSWFNNQTTWDGFTIENGIETGTNYGGGACLRSNGQITRCIIRNNMGGCGGGVSAHSATIANCQIYHNTATYVGGGIYASYAIITNCLIANNTADYNAGGGIYCIYSNIINSTIVRNISSILGSGIHNAGGNSMTNSIVWGNGMHEANNVTDGINCTYSAIEGGYEGDHNIDVSETELFINPSHTAGADDDMPDVDWHLLPNAICINKGLNDTIVGNVDLAGVPRINCDTVDMGCYEHYPMVEHYDTASSNYFWHNTNYTTSGDYYWMNPVMTGCDSIHVLHLTIGVGIADHDVSNFKIYPNPTSNIINVEFGMGNEELGDVKIQLYDVFGKLLDVVETQCIASLQRTQIDLSRYANGVYILKAVAGGKTVGVRKVVRQ